MSKFSIRSPQAEGGMVTSQVESSGGSLRRESSRSLDCALRAPLRMTASESWSLGGWCFGELFVAYELARDVHLLRDTIKLPYSDGREYDNNAPHNGENGCAPAL